MVLKSGQKWTSGRSAETVYLIYIGNRIHTSKKIINK